MKLSGLEYKLRNTTLDTVTSTIERCLRNSNQLLNTLLLNHSSLNVRTFSTGKQLRAFILHQRRSTALCLFTISLSNAQAFPFHTLLEIARRNSSRDSLHFTNPRSPRVVRSDPIRSEHNTFNTTLPSVRSSFR